MVIRLYLHKLEYEQTGRKIDVRSAFFQICKALKKEK